MNILLATDSNIERAGICMFMLHWIEEVRQCFDGGHITVYFRKGNKDDSVMDRYQKLGAEVVLGELPEKQTSISAGNMNKVRDDIRKIFHKRRYDVLHINSSAAGFTAIVLSEGVRAGVPVRISHSHGKNIGNGIKKTYLWGLRLYNRTQATKLAGCSMDAGKYMFGRGVEKNPKWILVPNTIQSQSYSYDEIKRKEIRDRLKINRDTIVLGAAGQLTEIKNHRFILSVMKELKTRGNKAVFILLGEGEERNRLEEQARLSGIEQEVFMPGVSSDMPAWLSSFDIYVMPSLTEGLPIGAIEAQANGLCCLFSDRVPDDIDITPNVYHLPIDRGTACWTDFIEHFRPVSKAERQLGADRIKKAGYDQNRTKEYIVRLYGTQDTKAHNLSAMKG